MSGESNGEGKRIIREGGFGPILVVRLLQPVTDSPLHSGGKVAEGLSPPSNPSPTIPTHAKMSVHQYR